MDRSYRGTERRGLTLLDTCVFWIHAYLEVSPMTPLASAVHPTHRSATWPTRRPWLHAIAYALVPVAFTAAGSAVAQVRGLSDLASYLTIAFAVTVSALVGLLVMWRNSTPLADFGLRRPHNAAVALWWLPPAVVVALVLMASGVTVPLAVVPGIAWLVLAVGLNEEIFFRGIVFKALMRYGTAKAVAFSALIFGVMHLANVASGKPIGYLVLQVLFSMLFGVVTAELVATTGSLWPGIVFHTAYDAVAYLGGDANSTRAFVSLAVQVGVLGVYAVWLWRRLPHEEDSA